MHRGRARSDKQQSRAQQFWHRECCEEIQVKSVTLLHTWLCLSRTEKKKPFAVIIHRGTGIRKCHLPSDGFPTWSTFGRTKQEAFELVSLSWTHKLRVSPGLLCLFPSAEAELLLCEGKSSIPPLLLEHQRITVDLTLTEILQEFYSKSSKVFCDACSLLHHQDVMKPFLHSARHLFDVPWSLLQLPRTHWSSQHPCLSISNCFLPFFVF